jgi:hypothetical protein
METPFPVNLSTKAQNLVSVGFWKLDVVFGRGRLTTATWIESNAAHNSIATRAGVVPSDSSASTYELGHLPKRNRILYTRNSKSGSDRIKLVEC